MQTISVLPETTAQVLCVRYNGTVTADDFKQYHYQEMIKHADENGYLNMVVCYDSDYIGWEPEAADANLKSIVELSTRARKLAYVNPQKRKIFLMRMVNDLLKDAEIRYFDSDQYAEAVRWANE
jgi:hypothetical protein